VSLDPFGLANLFLLFHSLIGQREHLINGQLEGIIKHPGKKYLQNGATLLYARIGVDFDEPNIKVRIYNVIVPEYLKALLPFIRVKLSLSRYHS
jgi:hypothetical protein